VASQAALCAISVDGSTSLFLEETALQLPGLFYIVVVVFVIIIIIIGKDAISFMQGIYTEWRKKNTFLKWVVVGRVKVGDLPTPPESSAEGSVQ
jgi:hypothetical protein